MLSVAEMRQTLLAKAQVLTSNTQVALRKARGRVLSADVLSPCQVPPCDNSAMDGYALCLNDLASGHELAVAGIASAGASPDVLVPDTVMRILTGAPVPAGADTVVIQEDAEIIAGQFRLRAGVMPSRGDNIRLAGEDIRQDDRLFARGHRLRAADLGLLASVGIETVPVYTTLRVGLLCTGNELCEPGQQPAPGQIFNSNRYLLAALLEEAGFEVVDAGIVADDPLATVDALRSLAARCDVLLSTGGVSVGDADHVRAAVDQLGQLDVWKVAMKPGKPFAFGEVAGRPFFGLPGNPVSALVTFLLLARPYLQVAAGSQVQALLPVTALAAFDWPKAGKREEYLRVQLQHDAEGLPRAIAYPNQGSGVLSSVCRADALLRVPAGATFAAGDRVECMLLHR